MKKIIQLQLKTILSFAVGIAFLLPCEVIHASSESITGAGFTSVLTPGNHIVTDTSKDAVTAKNKAGKNNKSIATAKCRKEGCNVYAEVDKSEQMMYVYVSGELQYSFQVSTGKTGHDTPNLDLRPSGPLAKKYTSTKYPEGDYQGMGNMPYCVFLANGYAIHGTTPGSFKKLGTKASHGCVRLHPEDASVFYDLVSSIGLENTWVTIHP
jgi:lipoprotein-anchoring transpeptidase ErfK/SrfK